METPLGPEQSAPGGRREVPRRRWPVVLGLAALGLAGAAVYVAAAPVAGPSVYSATATVDVNLTATEPSGGIVLIPGMSPTCAARHRSSGRSALPRSPGG